MNIESRISKNRTKLEEVIPLETPFVIFVDPCDTCNFQCKFCPTGNRGLMNSLLIKRYGPMQKDIFFKIVDDIFEFPEKIKVLRLFKDGEPLINKNLPEMIKYAKINNIAESIDTTTNASLLTPDITDALIKAGLDRINISIEGTSNEEYLNFSKSKIDFDKIVANVKYFYENKENCHMVVKINEDAISQESKKKFLDIFSPITDGISTEHIVSCWPTFKLEEISANDSVGIYGQPIKEVLVCPYVFYSFSINSDGTSSSCFLDWKRELLIGDIYNSSVKDLWNSKKLFDYQTMFLEGKRKEHPFCGGCSQLSHGMPDDIDNYREELLCKLVKEKY